MGRVGGGAGVRNLPAHSAARKRPQALAPPDGQGCGQKQARGLTQGLSEAAVTLVLPSWAPLFMEKQAKVFEIGASPDR